MKLFKKILVWSLISIVIQFSVLLYTNNYLLSTDTSTVTAKKVNIDTKKEENKIEIAIPNEAKQVSVSYDGSYGAYYQNDTLHVINNKDAIDKEMKFKEGSKISFYKWLPDRNRMLIVEKVQEKSGGTLKLSYYDVDKGEKVEVKDLTWVDSKSEVEDIKLSTLTNVIYIKVAHSSNKSSIYSVDIMKEMKKIDTKSNMIGNIEVIPHENKMLYEDNTYNKIYVTGVSEAISIKSVTKPTLLGVDSEDNIFIGQIEGDKVIKIYSGILKDPTSVWKVTQLNNPINKDDIYISSQGTIYVNDNLKGTITDVNLEKTSFYQGRFLQMYEYGVASISNGKLLRTSIR